MGIQITKVNKDNINSYLEEDKVIFIHDIKEENILPSENNFKSLEFDFEDGSLAAIKNNITRLVEVLIN